MEEPETGDWEGQELRIPGQVRYAGGPSPGIAGVRRLRP